MSAPPPVYLVAEDVAKAKDWAWRNKPGWLPKVFHPASTVGPTGLHIQDQQVYVFDELGVDAREAWARTGAHLVHV